MGCLGTLLKSLEMTMSGNNPFVSEKKTISSANELGVVAKLIALELLQTYDYVHVLGSRFKGGWRFQSDFDFAVADEDCFARRAFAESISKAFGVAVELRHCEYYDVTPEKSLRINRGDITLVDLHIGENAEHSSSASEPTAP